MSLIVHGDTLILRNGVLASSAACCCNCESDLDCPEGQYCCFGSCKTQTCSPCDYNACPQCYPELFLPDLYYRTQTPPVNPPLDPPCHLLTALRFQGYSGAPLNNQPPCFFSWSWKEGWPEKLGDCQYVWIHDVVEAPCSGPSLAPPFDDCGRKRKERYRLLVMTCPNGNGELVDITADAVNGSLECEDFPPNLGPCAEYPAYFDTPMVVCDEENSFP